MYGKPNKTEKRIIRAFADSSIDLAYEKLFNSGWVDDLSVMHVDGVFVQNMPKVHPDIVPPLSSITWGTAKTVTEMVSKGRYTLKDSNPLVKVVRDRQGMSRVVYVTDAGLVITFASPVNIVCRDKHDNIIWSVRLSHDKNFGPFVYQLSFETK